MRYNVAWVLLTGLTTVPFAGLLGQSIRGRVLNEITARPVAGAIVELTPDATGVPRQLITNNSGAFLLSGLPEGRYGWRVRAIGFSPSPPQAFNLTNTTLTLPDLKLRPVALPLIDVATRGAKICAGKSDPATLSTILQAAQNSIDVMDGTLRSGAYRFELHDTALVSGRAVLPPPEKELRYLQAWPVRAVSPELLRTIGFSMVDNSAKLTRRYFGPDPIVLFSSWFLNDHCYTLEERRNGRDTTIVVRFEPISTTRPEIAGELLIDRQSMAIKRITWEHRNLPKWIDQKNTSGEMVFDTIAAGVWYPSSWTMRAPSETLKQSGRLDGIDESPALMGPTTGTLTRITTVLRVIRP